MLGRMYFTGDDVYQSFLVFAPMSSSLTLDINKKVTNRISTGVSAEKTIPFDTKLELTMYNSTTGRVILKFNNSFLEQITFSSFYSNPISNLYILYELNNWLRNSTNKFPLKNCLFGTDKLVRNTDKSKFTDNGLGIRCDGEDIWSFGNDFVGNVVIFGLDNTSSSHTDNKKESIDKIFLSLHYKGNESYLYVNKTEICKFKAKDSISWYYFCLGNISNNYTKDDQSGISLDGAVYDFSVDHSSIK